MAVSKNHIEAKKRAIESCIKSYSLPSNPDLDDIVISLSCFPKTSSKKLAFLILTYKREATVQELKAVSDQPANIIL